MRFQIHTQDSGQAGFGGFLHGGPTFPVAFSTGLNLQKESHLQRVFRPGKFRPVRQA